MFRSNDKITLTLVNAKDIDGTIIPFSLKIPVDEEYNIPEDVASLDVFEYQEGTVNMGFIAFHLYIGKKSTIEELVVEDGIKTIQVKKMLDIPAVDSDICYQDVLGKHVVFANVDEQDIVVSNHEELRDVISNLSAKYKSFSTALGKIKQFSKTIK